jgi:hypothetical protein
MPYVYQEYPKWIVGPGVIVQNAAEERCIRWQWERTSSSSGAAGPWLAVSVRPSAICRSSSVSRRLSPP